MIRLYGTSFSGNEHPDMELRPRAALSCLRILCAVAGRAPWAAAKIARQPGLMTAVREVRIELISSVGRYLRGRRT